MIPIDLIDYTRSSKKISPEMLKISAPVSEKPFSTWKLLGAYFFDFSTVMTFTFMTSGIFKIAFKNLMMTGQLNRAFNTIPFHTLTTTILPLMFVSYFFFSFFFNNGQTPGMKMFKARIEMPDMSFRASLIWAMFSASVMMTAGLSFMLAYKWMQSKGWGEVKGHDHLYKWMMIQRDISPVNLVELSTGKPAAETPEEETYLEAA